MSELKQITFSLADNIHNKLLAYCKKTGQNKTAILRQAVYEFLQGFSYGNGSYNTTSSLYHLGLDDDE